MNKVKLFQDFIQENNELEQDLVKKNLKQEVGVDHEEEEEEEIDADDIADIDDDNDD